MRALVLGTPTPITARAVWHWLSAGHEIEEIWISQKTSSDVVRRDRELRWLAPTWSLHAAARKFGIRIRQVGPLRNNPEVAVSGCFPNVDVLLTAVFPCKIPHCMLDFYARRAVNLHPSLLPRFRGPRPMIDMIVQEQMDASGVTLHLLSSTFDAGDVVIQQPVPWPASSSFRKWEMSLADVGGQLWNDAIPKLLDGQIHPCPQKILVNAKKQDQSNPLIIHQNMTESRARWLGAALGRITPLTIPTDQGNISAGQVLRSQSKQKERPPFVSLLNVVCDVLDARLTFQRWNSLRRKLEKIRRVIALAANPLDIGTLSTHQSEKTHVD